MSSPWVSRCESAMALAFDSSRCGTPAGCVADAVAGADAGSTDVVSAGAGVVLFAGVRFAGVFLAGVLWAALVLDAAAGRTFARVMSADVAGKVAGSGVATGLGRAAVVEKTSLDRAKKASAGSAET